MRYQNHITCVLGHRGSGKSTWLYRNIDLYKPFVLVDPLSDPKFKALNLYQIKSMDEALKLFKDGKPERIYITPNLQDFDFFCGLVLAKRNITLIVDEVDNYCTNYFISPYFKRLVKYGRHRNVNLVMVARRPKEIHPLLRSQATRFIIFPLGGEDIREIASHIGKQAFLINKLQSVNNQDSDYLDFDYSNKEATIKNLKYLLDTSYSV